MKEILEFEQLPPNIKAAITDPGFNLAIERFCDTHTVSEQVIRRFIETKITDVAFGSTSIESCVEEISAVLELEITGKQNDVVQLLVEMFDEEAMEEIFAYDVNGAASQQSAPLRVVAQETAPVIQRDPETVQDKLLFTLGKFNLHVDEKGIIAHEVERYLKGEVASKDLVPHLTALLDKPLSEINQIVALLNQEIFKPIQKQIAEEGTLDISGGDDLKDYLAPSKKGFSITKQVEEKRGDATSLGMLSFVPESLKDSRTHIDPTIVSDLMHQGGTPSGTSLLSQETVNKQVEESLQLTFTKNKPKQTYTIDPYREIPE